jgi:hypothetical protein
MSDERRGLPGLNVALRGANGLSFAKNLEMKDVTPSSMLIGMRVVSALHMLIRGEPPDYKQCRSMAQKYRHRVYCDSVAKYEETPPNLLRRLWLARQRVRVTFAARVAKLDALEQSECPDVSDTHCTIAGKAFHTTHGRIFRAYWTVCNPERRLLDRAKTRINEGPIQFYTYLQNQLSPQNLALEAAQLDADVIVLENISLPEGIAMPDAVCCPDPGVLGHTWLGLPQLRPVSRPEEIRQTHPRKTKRPRTGTPHQG